MLTKSRRILDYTITDGGHLNLHYRLNTDGCDLLDNL